MTQTCPYAHLDLISAPVFVLEISDAGMPVYAALNACALALIGRPASDFIGRSSADVFPHAYGRTACAQHCAALTSGSSVSYQIDLPLARGISTLRSTLRPEVDQTGRVIRLWGGFVDLTAEKLAVEARKDFDTLSSEMEQFVAFAAHDLRAPMRNIAALTNLMREDAGPLGDPALDIIDLIEKITAQSMDLISDVLSHAESTATVKEESSFSFPALCHGIWDAIDPAAQHRLTTSLSNLRADRTAIRIALRNIAENAVKHGGCERLDVDISVQEDLPGMLDITVTDNGQGFTEGALEVMNGGRLRVDSGYGLFGIKRLIAARGGTLLARNLPDGAGAVVRFSLPGTLLGSAPSDAPFTLAPLAPPPTGREIRLSI
ncbi:ATP-binding protein [Marimonas sp. MJW-29]|uniref:histidine kinase n=1 Tax=Sulfitobacter sediminis TaxID=3234186 RepID=A0ABV3RSY0_9RHOB